MLTDEEIKEYLDKLNSSGLTDYEKLQIIKRYIKDKKGVEVTINEPESMLHKQLLNIAFEHAWKYYSLTVN